ncbi:hypothetical protein PHYBLDRAFT_176076 [Phycomyces blakesleeanus NRRL 1555(-)]|uniref:Uncharacterized protein n=1 Tax=Phycomyces blakesleeanus (strain ATCC 8743b / DSM 1359 / FGSC 10004 / NBRC 33097 / NRRL 1555) TaxID=763407 RepID=A0A162ZAP9_PHYB8|nr:hypothetical protein PHYBLDRAFT_176076 [Phycomyces blakesleeanus NRRL 1555(-)]OAD65481.1 hypothetical protein PHYBLDRAFT_176076 [Phycomyces blakesleeanus NRRL 1555(-)]|eukprot:XP_018283521.1 hypothetical protein PHYBLDRAFT_176076 [Phycomyces blakesleeanus NRRL 1555(-)]
MPTPNRRLAPSLASTDVQLLQALNAMKEEMTAMKDKITLMDTRIGVVITGNATAINGIDVLSALPVSAHVPTSVASTSAALPITESSDTNTVFVRIHSWLYVEPKAKIQANAIKPKELVKQLLYYLEKKFAGTDLRTRDLRKCMYTNFCSRRCQQRELPETRRALNTNSRRSGRETDNYTRHHLAYDAYKADIDLKMGQNCSGLIQKSVMSEGKSDDDMSPPQPRNEIRVARPSWRSDKLNKFITEVDSFVVKQLGANSRQLLKRVYGRTVESTVPIDLDPALPQWALKYGS